MKKPMKIEDGRPGMHVRCIKGQFGNRLEEGEVYAIAIVVEKGRTGRGEDSGFVLRPIGNGPNLHPYVWDADRFEPVEHTTGISRLVNAWRENDMATD